MTSEGRRGARRVLLLAGVLMAVAAVVLLVVSPGGDDGPSGGPVPEAGSRFRDGERPSRIDAKAEPATIERAAAQLFAAGFAAGERPQRVWGMVVVDAGHFRSAPQLRRLATSLRRSARRADRPLPLVLADPEELGSLGPADQPTLGVEGSPADARETARRSASRVRRAGVDVVLAPSADLGVGGTPGELRAFGDEPEQVARYVAQAVDGWRDGRVVPVPGRFPGEGAASQDPIEGPATVGLSLDDLLARDTRPFAGVVARAPAIQMSAALYAAWDGVTPATLLPDAVRLLRGRLGFRGAVVSADLIAATAATGESVAAAAVAALKAGCDVLLVPGGRREQEEALRAVVRGVRSGAVSSRRFNEAVGRVEQLRRAAGRT